MKAIEMEDFAQYRMPSALAFSENGAYGVFCVSQADLKSNSYRSNLWMLETATGKISRLTGGGKERSFSFNGPDSILFPGLRGEADQKAVRDGEQLTVFYEISLHGGEAVEAFRVPLRGASAKRLKEGYYLITASFDNIAQQMREAAEQAGERPAPPRREAPERGDR